MTRMDEILGQTRAIEQLRAQVAAGRVHHAQLFFGPEGVGKFTTARAFARLLLCHTPETDLTGRRSACGGCASCRVFRSAESDDADAGSDGHPDLHVVNKELAAFHPDKKVRDRKQTTIPVDIVRDALIKPAYLAPQLNHGKVFIVDEAHLLRHEGQNALLKVLEEPPTGGAKNQSGGTTIILITPREDTLLPTIRSRCQRTAFVPLPDDVVDRYLDEHAADPGPRGRSWLTAFAAGSLGRARLALDHDLAEWAQTVLPGFDGLAEGRAEGGLGSAMEARIKAFAEGWVKKHKQASKEAANKNAAGLMFRLVTTHARQQLTKAAAACDPGDPDAAEAALRPWTRLIDDVGTAETRLASNVHLGLLCDGLVASAAGALRP